MGPGLPYLHGMDKTASPLQSLTVHLHVKKTLVRVYHSDGCGHSCRYDPGDVAVNAPLTCKHCDGQFTPQPDDIHWGTTPISQEVV